MLQFPVELSIPAPAFVEDDVISFSYGVKSIVAHVYSVTISGSFSYNGRNSTVKDVDAYYSLVCQEGSCLPPGSNLIMKVSIIDNIARRVDFLGDIVPPDLPV